MRVLLLGALGAVASAFAPMEPGHCRRATEMLAGKKVRRPILFKIPMGPAQKKLDGDTAWGRSVLAPGAPETRWQQNARYYDLHGPV